jgi:hypothetical protein
MRKEHCISLVTMLIVAMLFDIFVATLDALRKEEGLRCLANAHLMTYLSQHCE